MGLVEDISPSLPSFMSLTGLHLILLLLHFSYNLYIRRDYLDLQIFDLFANRLSCKQICFVVGINEEIILICFVVVLLFSSSLAMICSCSLDLQICFVEISVLQI
ncbi:hypothetical protein GIB67_043115 [Kingdonia uniflora]|uniref:Uncharacterized protein n=1 Tax=Kingdonia uniflora TaxID=39325 RepID=A0A7J7NJV5_9MAGN|nr:hypothetical protein GIB67_043115 [Kingdonia uniflora]